MPDDFYRLAVTALTAIVFFFLMIFVLSGIAYAFVRFFHVWEWLLG